MTDCNVMNYILNLTHIQNHLEKWTTIQKNTHEFADLFMI